MITTQPEHLKEPSVCVPDEFPDMVMLVSKHPTLACTSLGYLDWVLFEPEPGNCITWIFTGSSSNTLLDLVIHR